MATRKRKPKQLTDDDIAALPTKTKRYSTVDTEQRGLHIRITPKGAKSFWAVARSPSGEQLWLKVGDALLGIDKARTEARRIIAAIVSGEDPAGPQSFEVTANEWFSKKGAQLRSAKNIRWNLDKHILPVWRHRDFASIRRGDIAKLLDDIRERVGEASAESVFSIVRRIVFWHARRNEAYIVPLVHGMGEFNAKARARERILDDAEIRAVWSAAERNGTFGAFLRLALITVQRKDKIISMCWVDIVDGVWRIPSEEREKGNAGELPLPKIALDIIYAQPRFASNPFVLAGQSGKHWNSFSEAKTAFDKKVPIPHWTIHDLRRTGRSLLSRAGVDFHIAERCLGHEIGGVAGTYDRHKYTEEKGIALRRLADIIDLVLRPPVDGAGRADSVWGRKVGVEG